MTTKVKDPITLAKPYEKASLSFLISGQRILHIMSCGINLVSNGVSGEVLSDGKFLPCKGAHERKTVEFSPFSRGFKLFVGADSALQCSFIYRPRRVSFSCKSSSNKGIPDFSRTYRGPSRGKSWKNQERESSENSEDGFLSSKNGPLLSLSSNNRKSPTATPGQREKEIVELFRKVQAQLRERSAIKEEKRIESAQQDRGERGTVDSLLKLLRKHSVAQGNKSSNEDEYGLDQTVRPNPFEQLERCDPSVEEQNFSFYGSDNLATEDEVDEPKSMPSSRPVSKFRRKSPVPRVKFQPVFSAGEESIASSGVTSHGKMKNTTAKQRPSPIDLLTVSESKLQPDTELKAEFQFSDGVSGMPSDLSCSSDTDDTDQMISEASIMETADLSSMKLSELRGLAKCRRIKGYSKLKKSELLELLSSDSV